MHAISMPVLVGKEGEAVSLPKRRGRKGAEPAETGRPETSREFAARVKDHFTLKGPIEKGPVERLEGVSSKNKGNEKLTIRIPARKQTLSKNGNAEASASASGQIDTDTMASIDDGSHDMPNRPLGAESPNDAVDASLPKQPLAKHM